MRRWPTQILAQIWYQFRCKSGISFQWQLAERNKWYGQYVDVCVCACSLVLVLSCGGCALNECISKWTFIKTHRLRFWLCWYISTRLVIATFMRIVWFFLSLHVFVFALVRCACGSLRWKAHILTVVPFYFSVMQWITAYQYNVQVH